MTVYCTIPCPVFTWECTLQSGQHHLLHSNSCLPSAVLFSVYKETSLYLKIQFLSNIKYTPYLLHKVAKTVERNNWFVLKIMCNTHGKYILWGKCNFFYVEAGGACCKCCT